MREKFLHNLTPKKGSCGYSKEYMICDVVWHGYSLKGWEYLSCHPCDNTILHLELSAESVFSWEYTYKIAEGIYCRSNGSAQNIEQACREALSYVPETLTLEYLGRYFSWYGSPRHSGTIEWNACVDGNKAEVFGPLKYGEEPEYFIWKRHWPPAEPVLASFSISYGYLEGKASSLREACVAAIIAPEEFTRACGVFAATLKQGFPDGKTTRSNDD
jgi:hypothetical protein